MKKLLFTIVCLATAWTASAQTSSMFELSVGGGWSSLGYKLSTGDQINLTTKQTGSYGLNAHFGYGIMFCRYVGIGLGVDFAHYGAIAKLGGAAEWLGVSDTEGEKYDHCTNIDSWKDQQDIWNVEIPFTVYFRAPLPNRKAWFSAELGAKIGIPVVKSAKYSGSLSHTAGYEPWQLDLANVRGHGFYSSEMSDSYSISPKTGVAAFAKLGFETPLDEKEHLFFFAHVYATYYFTKVLSQPDTPVDLGFHNDTSDPVMKEAHYFMSDYTSVLDTKLSNGKVNPIGIGVEIGIRFRLEHPKSYDCNCVRD